MADEAPADVPVTDVYRRDWKGQGEQQPGAPAHEASEIARPKIILALVAGLLGGGALLHLVLYGLLGAFHVSPGGGSLTRFTQSLQAMVTPVPPSPHLQTAPGLDLQTLRSHETALLTTYGWGDRSRGVVRIPIDRAMALLAARGLPYTTDLPAAPFPHHGVLLGGETPAEGTDR